MFCGGDGWTLDGKDSPVSTKMTHGIGSIWCGKSAIPMILLTFFLAMDAYGHLGQKNIIQQAMIGDYPARVIIKRPDVIPGIAQIFIRFEAAPALSSVSVQPIAWYHGKEGSPPPDPAIPVEGDPGLYRADLWIMTGSAYSINLYAEGPEGDGKAHVPFATMATNTPAMSAGMQALMFGFLFLLVVMLLAIIRQAVLYSTKSGASEPGKARALTANMITAGGFLIILAAVYVGKKWWDSEEKSYMSNRLYKPIPAQTQLYTIEDPGKARLLKINFESGRLYRNGPIVPDHGKQMHVFLVSAAGEKAGNSAGHMHPVKFNHDTFWGVIPDSLPAGRYHLYADISQESGFAQTLVGEITLEDSGNAFERISEDELGEVERLWVRSRFETLNDQDNSWFNGKDIKGVRGTFTSDNDTWSLKWSGSEASDSSDQLTFDLFDRDGNELEPELYLGMRAHAVVTGGDGNTYTHLHPTGNVSMAAMQLFELRDSGALPREIGKKMEPICELPDIEENLEVWKSLDASRGLGRLTFPYLAPDAMDYRVWVQFKLNGVVRTAYFELPLKAD